MKKLLSIICITAMLLTVFALPTFAAEEKLPALLITAISCNQDAATSNDGSPVGPGVPGIWDAESADKGQDVFEFILVENTTDKDINLYDGYALGYNGTAANKANFRHQVTETTFFAKGTDWVDGSDMEASKIPVNPDKAVLAPGESAFIWMFASIDYTLGVNQIKYFRDFWKVPDNVLVIAADANGGADGNFNIKNSATGTYMICNFKDSKIDAFAADKVLVPNVAAVKYTVEAGIDSLDEVICYVSVCHDTYEGIKKVTNANNVVFRPIKNATSDKWYEASDEAFTCLIPTGLNTKPSDPVTPPATGDAGMILALIATISLAGVVVAKKSASR